MSISANEKLKIKELLLFFETANTNRYDIIEILNELDNNTLEYICFNMNKLNIGVEKRKIKDGSKKNKKKIKYNPKCFIKNISKYKSTRNKIKKIKGFPFEIKKLIASGSEGAIYLIEYKGIDFALKIMSITNMEDGSGVYFNKNIQEIKFSEMFGKAVDNKENPYFPIYLTGGYSENIEYPKDKLGNELKDSAIRYIKYLKNKDILPESIKITDEDRNIKNLPFQYMILELGIINLRAWIETYKSDDKKEKLFGFIRDALYGLDYMHRKGVYHADLHSANVLILERKCGLIAVINDFGGSEIPNKRKSRYLADVNNLIEDIIDALKGSKSYDIINRLLDILKNIESISKSLKDNYIDLIPNIIDEFILINSDN